jgi:parallel beta-helix repeat protein
MNKKNITLLLSFLFVGLITTASAANPIYVNNEYTTSNAGTHIFGVNAFTTIKEGIDNVDIGGTIHVAHGVYKENIIIEKSLSLLGDGATTLYGAGKSSPTIDGGASTTPATITINGATKSISVIISNFSIINSGNGINVLQNAVVMITKNTISGYRKNGITFGPVLYPGYGGVRGVISNNSIIGAGPTTTISQNGIQVSENNAATIINNKISNHIYDVPDSFWASGILIHQSNNVFTSRNILSDNQAGINIMQGSYNKITNNTINGNSFTKAGITLNGSTNKELPTTNANSIEGNTISGGSVGIWASNTASTTYSNNIISSSTDNGIYSWNSDNSTF